MPAIHFKLIDTNLSSTVTIFHIEDNNYSLTLHCSSKIGIKRILETAFHLFRIRKRYYCLHCSESQIDEDILLEDFGTGDNIFEFQLISTATIKCVISYTNQTTILPCNKEMSKLELVKYALELLHMEDKEIDSYELFLIINGERSQVEDDLIIEELLQMLFDEMISTERQTLKFELEKKSD
ncbi:unnamed protein product [Adineta steineri]|uniref:Uncharacterized protein n=1 Tax=Adineta steineri TaxID=433720 RepID=A0A814INE8_9BILA|nr:unnamed protein product [Adineta steineri]CAF1044222.1 unnamed protein product [Adineta steineri]